MRIARFTFVCAALAVGTALGVAPAVLAGDEAETLRLTQVQLRQSEQERSALRAELARLQEQLQAQARALESTRQDAQRVAQQKAAPAANEGALNERLQQSAKVLRASRDELERLRLQNSLQGQAVENLQKLLEQTRATLALRDEFIELCRVRNKAMYSIGHDILKMSRDDEMNSLAAREPVLKLKQVELENLAQDLEVKLREQRIHADTLTPSQEQALRASMQKKAQPQGGEKAAQ